MNRQRFAATAIGLLLTAGGCGCSSTKQVYVDDPEEPGAKSDAGFDTTPSPDSGLGVLQFMPAQSYSGYDGTHPFKVPLAVYDSGDDLTVTVTDPAAAEVVPTKLAKAVRDDGVVDTGKYFLVIVKKSGTISLEAKSHGDTATATIQVAEYAADRWSTGEKRYVNGGGGDPPCTNCHVNGSAIDHSPAALATATDEKVGAVITTGISTHGFPITIGNEPGHRWTVTDEERDGLVTYLRALEPKGFE